jgi:transposase
MKYNNLTMARFKYTDNSQGQFIAVNLKEQIAIGTFEWAVSYIIDRTDMSSFEKNYRNDASGLRPAGAGCPPPKEAHPPALLLKVILFCPSRGIITPRKIERACKDNIITKALAEDLEPDRDTIATFISTNNEEVKDLSGQVLFKCSGLKWIKLIN